LRADLKKIRDTPYLSILYEVAGFVHDIDSGHITEVVEA
jgi:hypothetical protein